MKWFVILLMLLSLSCSFTEKSATPDCRPEFQVPLSIPGQHYVEFMAVGDVGTGQEGQQIVAQSMALYALQYPVQLVLLLGDSFYPSGVESVMDSKFESHFEEIYDPTILNMPFYAILGNHDHRGNVDAQINYSGPSNRWMMPDRYYTFSLRHEGTELVQFFALDTTPMVLGHNVTAQLEWLTEQLLQSTASWKILLGHHPIFSNGDHGDNPKLKQILLPLLEQHNVDIYISSHDHDLQILDTARHFLQLVSGAGSSTRETLCKENSIYAASLLGFMAFRVSSQQLQIFVLLHEGITDFAYSVDK
jgi:tartrate-resistant acid phosphatase type 5